MSSKILSAIWERTDIERRWGCRIEPDPALALPRGSVIHFTSLTFAPEGASNFARVVEPEQMQGVVLSLQFSNTDGTSAEGSAVIVAPGVALCAGHVVRDHLAGIESGTTGVIGVCIVADGLQVWRVTHVTSIPDCDISIVGLSLACAMPPDSTFRRAALVTRMPKLGETLTLTGFAPREAIECATTGNGNRQFKVRVGMLATRGAVTACYPAGRDRVVLPWPVVEVDCPAFGAMSGGPVFDSRGHLVGLVCSSFETVADLAEGPAYVSLLWPALFAPFAGGWPTVLMRGTTTLHALNQAHCTILGRENITEVLDPVSGEAQRFVADWDYSE